MTTKLTDQLWAIHQLIEIISQEYQEEDLRTKLDWQLREELMTSSRHLWTAWATSDMREREIAERPT